MMENNTISNILWGTLLGASWVGMYYWGFKIGEKSGHNSGYTLGLQEGFNEGFLKESDELHPKDPLPFAKAKGLGAISREKHDLFTTNHKSLCNDGLYSTVDGRGACTKHGGVKRYI